MHYLTINITHPIGFVKDFFPPGCFWKAPFAGMTVGCGDILMRRFFWKAPKAGMTAGTWRWVVNGCRYLYKTMAFCYKDRARPHCGGQDGFNVDRVC